MEVQLTSDNFTQEVLQAQVPVLVDFWAPWCGPCMMIAPHIEELAKNYAGKVKVAKLNVDEAPDIATQYTVMSIPTLMMFKGGKVMAKQVGAMGKHDLEKFIASHAA
jgi:thioredoxin 1